MFIFLHSFSKKECLLIMLPIFLIEPPLLPTVELWPISFQERPGRHDHWTSCHSLSPLLFLRETRCSSPKVWTQAALSILLSTCMAGHTRSSLWAAGSCTSEGESSTTTPFPLPSFQAASLSPTNVEMIKVKLQGLCDKWHKVRCI